LLTNLLIAGRENLPTFSVSVSRSSFLHIYYILYTVRRGGLVNEVCLVLVASPIAAVTTGISDEVLVGSLPVCLIGCLVHTLLEVVKKTLLAFGAVEETALGSAAWLVQELLIDDGLRAAAHDKLCLLHDTAVVLLLELLSRVGINV